jgi:hypothetical protein
MPRSTPLLNRPWALALLAGFAVLAVALLPPLWTALRAPAPTASAGGVADTHTGMPWDVQDLGGGRSRVFGITLPGSTLAEVERLWPELQLALIEPAVLPAAAIPLPPSPVVLEAQVERFETGGIQGRLFLSARAEPAQLERWRTAAVKREPGSGGGWRYVMRLEDRTEAAAAVVDGISFIPAARLDAAVLLQRFGDPAERLQAADGLTHWLYPARGLAIGMAERGRDVLQYVPPQAFEQRLRAPLLGAVKAVR